MLPHPLPCPLQAELVHQEQSMTESRRERDKVITEYRRQAEEKKEFAEKVEKRVGELRSRLNLWVWFIEHESLFHS